MMTVNLKNYRVILASRSPRRQQLLRQAGISFDVVVRDFDETYPSMLRDEEIARYISSRKAESFKKELKDNEIVITADTIVWCGDAVLGKPEDARMAADILHQISDKTHEVITGVTLISNLREITFSDITKVTFEKLSDEEIDYYVENYKPFDKAGAYGIQEWIGIIGCSRIEGSFFNVVGLPVQKLYSELKNFVI